jgi:serine/threonine protein kinase
LLPSSNIETQSQPSLLAPGDILQERYRIVRQLGKGGMGAVYEAVDQRLDATVALKETFSVDSRLRRQFEQEARLLAQLTHPALPRVSDYFTENDRAFLVMQFVSGVDLAEIIAQQPGPFPRNQVVAWADQLLDALIYLHTRDRQIIHRDIKPHNLKLSSTGQIALLDFGLAKTQSADRSSGDTSTSIFGYTRRYAPLEQIQDQGTTPQSDIYALGATLYHLLTGVKPADALIRAAAAGSSMSDPLRPANEINPAVGAELASILSRAMAQNPEDRYPNATSFREALSRLGRSENEEPDDSIPAPAINTQQTGLGEVLASKPRVRTSNPFDSYSILKPEEAEWFRPRRQSRNPNAVVAGVLFVLLIGLIGALYGYRQWNEASSSGSRNVKTGSSQRGPEAIGQQNRVDKLRVNANPIVGLNVGPATESGRKISDSDRRAADGKGTAQDRKAFVIIGDSLNTRMDASLLPHSRRSDASPKINIPEARLPKAELKANDPAPAIHGLPAFGQTETVVERQVLRTPDGTQVVRFSDGTTKVFRPGEKSTTGISPQ